MDVNAYSVFNAIDAGIVNTSTVGLELSLLGKPVIVAARTHYRGKGFTIDPMGVDEYDRAIVDLVFGGGLSPDQVSEAERYAHMFFFQHHLRLPFFEELPGTNIICRARLRGGEKDAVGNLDQWMNAFERKIPFVLPRGD